MKYIINPNKSISLNGETILTTNQIKEAIILCNQRLKQLSESIATYDINIFEALGMRNLSGFVGEVFVKSLENVAASTLTKNPHQDGYPDLLLTNSTDKKSYFNSIVNITENRIYPKNKDLFSPFKYGGLEVKATCGSTPPASRIPKPLIGETRINILTKFEWKAHHRDTNHLIGLLWDFIDGLPVIVSCFYCDELTTEDWGKIVTPKEGGGRTTSVSIMTSKGVSKMCNNWLVIIDNDIYLETLSKQKWIGYNPKLTTI